MYRKVLLTFSSFFCGGIALHLPPDIQTCKRSDTDYNKCLKSALQDVLPKLEKGLSDLKLPPMQPLFVSSFTVGEGKGVVHVVQNYKNLNFYDMTNATIDNVETKVTNKGFDLIIDASLPQVRIEGDYELNGQVLVVPVVGKGTCTLVFKNMKVRFTIRSEVFEKKGVSYLEIKDFEVELKPERLSYDYRNLFDGNERLGVEINKLLNDNWKEVWEDVRAGYEEAIGAVLKNLGNLVFKKVPYAELFPQ